VLAGRLIGVAGRFQREGLVVHIVADRLMDLSFLLGELARGEALLNPPLARADEVRRPGHDARELPYRSRDFH